jgi:SAM-dependent methyltransferase
MVEFLKKLLQPHQPAGKREKRIAQYLAGGRVPWSVGYEEYKWREIAAALHNPELLRNIAAGNLPSTWGVGLDERIVEYPWIFSKLCSGRLLDAGSTFNFPEIIRHPSVKSRELTIFTLEPERHCFAAEKISYLYGDLRNLPFRDAWFQEVVCHSTIEHIGMDNSMYGEKEKAGGDHLTALRELVRVLSPGGHLLLTFPCGKFEDHGFFHQFDADMIEQVKATLASAGTVRADFFRYRPDGWHCADWAGCADAESFNPHTGRGRGDDGAAHCRAVCCVEFEKQT